MYSHNPWSSSCSKRSRKRRLIYSAINSHPVSPFPSGSCWKPKFNWLSSWDSWITLSLWKSFFSSACFYLSFLNFCWIVETYSMSHPDFPRCSEQNLVTSNPYNCLAIYLYSVTHHPPSQYSIFYLLNFQSLCFFWWSLGQSCWS